MTHQKEQPRSTKRKSSNNYGTSAQSREEMRRQKEEVKLRISITDLFRELFPTHYRERGNSYCPFHDDLNSATPGLQINEDRGKVYCHSCSKSFDHFDLVMTAQGVNFKDSLHHLASRAGVELGTSTRRLEKAHTGALPEEATYDYVDETGRLIFQVVRQRDKTFPQRRPGKHEKWIWDLNGVKRILYRLPNVLKAPLDTTIILVEGEKDVLTAERLGFTATTSPGGSGQWGKLVADEGHLPLKGRKIWLIPDNDDAGAKYVYAIRQTLAFDADIRVIKLPGLSRGGDISDFCELHGPEKAREAVLSLGPVGERLMPKMLLGKDFKPDQWAELIVGKYHLAYFSNSYYAYKNGVYESIEQLQVDNFTRPLGDGNLRMNHYNEVRHAIRVAGARLEAEIDPPHLINLRNGFLDTSGPTPKFIPHSHTILSTMQLAVDYDPSATCPQFDAFLQEKIPDEALRLRAWEMIGYLLTSDTSLQVGFMLYGDTTTGKSTLSRIITALLGRERVSSVSLKQMGERFQLHALVGKLLNISGDEDVTAMVSDGIFKKITGEDPIQVERKGVDSYSTVLTARLMVLANKLPGTKDHSDAFFRRWIVIPMNVTTTPEKTDRNLVKKIVSSQLSGILNKALDGLQRLRTQGRFTDCVLADAIRDEWRFRVDPLRQWADERMTKSEGARIPLSDLLKDYRNWGMQSQDEKLSMKEFRERLETTLKVRIINPQNRLTVCDWLLVKDVPGTPSKG